MSNGYNAVVPLNLSHIPYGGDYNPEQWAEAIWDDDMRLMNEAHWNIATLPVFGWASLEPEEGVYTFEWLDRILDKLYVGGVQVCFATATASQPAWLDQKHPDVLVTHHDGVKARHGNRHSFCPNSANFRRLSTTLVRKLAERYKEHPALALWHVSNEYGTHCYCAENCAPAFREWLKAKYGSLDELNYRWYTRFWGHTFTDWSQIEPPYANGERSMNALRLDYYRFQSDSLLNCFRAEKEVLREITPTVPVTTNLMGAFFNLNYREWAKEMDVVSWDNYPAPNANPADIAFAHALTRGLKEGQPFLLMEQSPSQQNWQPYNAVKPPKQLRLQSFQAIAQGADSVMYFQWRRGRGGIEKMHGAMMEHHGRADTRVFQDVAELGADLRTLGAQTIAGRVAAKVAVLFDWENWWNIRFGSGPSVDLDYVREVRSAFSALYTLGIQCDILCPDADLSSYEVVIAPTLSLIRAADGERLKAYVQNGGALLATVYTGLVDDTDLVYETGAPGPLTEVLGFWSEELDALPKGKTNGIRFGNEFETIAAGEKFCASLLCERIRLTTAETLATYTEDFYAGEPVFTRNAYGKGTGYFLATSPDPEGWRGILGAICAAKGIVSPLAGGALPPTGVEVTRRVSPAADVLYVLNHNTESVDVPLEAGTTYTNLLTGETLTEQVTLGIREVGILKKE